MNIQKNLDLLCYEHIDAKVCKDMLIIKTTIDTLVKRICELEYEVDNLKRQIPQYTYNNDVNNTIDKYFCYSPND